MELRTLALVYLVGNEAGMLSPREERLLVMKALQARPWGTVAEALDFHSVSTCMRTLGEAVGSLVEAYSDEASQRERSG